MGEFQIQQGKRGKKDRIFDLPFVAMPKFQMM